MLTEQMLRQMPPGCIFATGTVKDDRIKINTVLRWIARRQDMRPFWLIYYHAAANDINFIWHNGILLENKEVIKELVPCDESAFKLYRY